jgi:hypothetical protein
MRIIPPGNAVSFQLSALSSQEKLVEHRASPPGERARRPFLHRLNRHVVTVLKADS